MGEVSSLREIEAEHDIARLEEREVDRCVRLRSRMCLDICMLGVEKFLQPVDGELLYHVYELAATVVAFAGQTLGVLVGERCAHRLQHGSRHEILAGYQLEAVPLPIDLEIDDARDLRI